ncbi:hypothetical protein [Actinomycetospora soli]|uniref:hypothetical protein n=1 Tax=Actinomycetospora soli TaxID=2893887 RepID=UPI001E575993|nr:hypothetical protein [Actinomycetospora soli]MCD2187290.1 hypothetical protein [Actinomycetospora soli]
MVIRLTTYGPASLVAVALAGDADDMPRDVRLVEPEVAAEIEALVEEHHGEQLLGVDLDTLVEEATARVDAARR